MEPPSNHAIAIVNESGRRAPRSLLRRVISATLDLHRQPSSEVVVLLCSDKAIAELNSRFRCLDEPTDVLTFPADDFPGAPLGDIAISTDYAERQAAVRRVSLSQELGYLAIHGTLHLLGFDDEDPDDQAKMMNEMNRAAVKAGLKSDENWSSLLHTQGEAKLLGATGHGGAALARRPLHSAPDTKREELRALLKELAA